MAAQFTSLPVLSKAGSTEWMQRWWAGSGCSNWLKSLTVDVSGAQIRTVHTKCEEQIFILCHLCCQGLVLSISCCCLAPYGNLGWSQTGNTDVLLVSIERCRPLTACLERTEDFICNRKQAFRGLFYEWVRFVSPQIRHFVLSESVQPLFVTQHLIRLCRSRCETQQVLSFVTVVSQDRSAVVMQMQCRFPNAKCLEKM